MGAGCVRGDGCKRGSMALAFIQITDHHLRKDASTLTRGYNTAFALEVVLRHIAEHNSTVDFMVTTGDLVETGSDEEYRYARSLIGLKSYSSPPGPQLASFFGVRSMPVYVLPGNHDPRDAFFRNMFPSTVEHGKLPAAMNALFEHNGVQFVCIDWGNENKALTTSEMLEHLAQALENPLPSIILSHHNVTPAGMARLNALVADDIDRFADTIRNKQVLAIFNGHTHATYESAIAGVPVYGLRSTTYSFAQSAEELCFVLRPPHYRVVTVADGAVSSRIVEVAI